MHLEINLTERFSALAHKIHPKVGALYDSDVRFWNDGFVGFVIGVPLTWLLYNFLIVPRTHDQIILLAFYVLCALISFCIQHVLRRKWVFRSEELHK